MNDENKVIYNQAVEFFENKEYEKALELFEKLIDEYQTNEHFITINLLTAVNKLVPYTEKYNHFYWELTTEIYHYFYDNLFIYFQSYRHLIYLCFENKNYEQIPIYYSKAVEMIIDSINFFSKTYKDVYDEDIFLLYLNLNFETAYYYYKLKRYTEAKIYLNNIKIFHIVNSFNTVTITTINKKSILEENEYSFLLGNQYFMYIVEYFLFVIFLEEDDITNAINLFISFQKSDIHNPNLHFEKVFLFQIIKYYFYKGDFENAEKYSIKFTELLDVDKNSLYYNHQDSLRYEGTFEYEENEVKKILDSCIKEQREQELRLQERNKVIADLSHSIKNLIGGSIMASLENLRKEIGDSPLIKNAIKGSELIKRIVTAMNLSFSGSINDFYFDAKNNNESITLKTLITESLKYSTENMFDSKYFSQFKEQYFPTKEIYIHSKKIWDEIINSGDLSKIQNFLNENMINFEYDFDNSINYSIGDEKGSATKLMILFQEIIFNAVKYSSFVVKNERNLIISLKKDKENIIFDIKNSCLTDLVEKSTGLGKEIISNFTKLLQTQPIVKKENNIYSVQIVFKNFWEN